ncbi:MAG: carboxypeptidase regulatory-like domain-containing protein, partial [Planctomycetes bacterium]|nr:carboxypeptidase regulatory-like domain-containing protein [Planctomycetota bacterium]
EFELGELPPGRVRITVEHATGSATAELDLAAAERRRWDPVLAAIEMVAGRVVDTELRPVAGIEVLVGGPTMAATAAVERTDADGRFRLAVASAGEAGVDLYLRRAGAPLAVRHGLLPVAGELLIELAEHELPSATIRGRILDRDGRPIAAALSVMNHGFQIAWYAFSDPATGAFRVGPTAPGSYTLIVEASGFGRRPLRVVNLAAGEDRELEDVGLEPAGRVELRLVGDASKQRKVLKFARDDGVVVAHSITEGSAVTVELPPGRYAATVVGGPFSGSTTILDLPAGRTVQRELPCIASARVALQLRAAAGHGIGGRVDVRVRDAAGAFFDAYELFAGNAAELTTTIALPPGSYAVELESTDGLAAATLLTVRSATDHPTLTIELR